MAVAGTWRARRRAGQRRGSGTARWLRGARGGIVNAGAVLTVVALALGAIAVPVHAGPPPAPVVDVYVDGPYLRVVWPHMERLGAQSLVYRLEELDGDRVVHFGSVDRSFLRVRLPPDGQLELRLAGTFPGASQSDWSAPMQVAADIPTVPPWTVRLRAGDGMVDARWSDTGADEHRYHLWSGPDDHRFVWTTDTEAAITGLTNGKTYRLKMMSRYGSTYSEWTETLSITPSAGSRADIEVRRGTDYYIADPGMLAIPTHVVDHRERVDDVVIHASAVDGHEVTAGSAVAPEIEPEPGSDRAYLSAGMALGELDYDIVTELRGLDGVLASSLQLFVGSAHYDLDLDPESDGGPGRSGTFR